MKAEISNNNPQGNNQQPEEDINPSHILPLHVMILLNFMC